MSIVVPDVGKQQFNWMIWANSSYNPSTYTWAIHLGVSNLSLSASTTLSDVQAVEASFTGYSPIALTGATDGGIITGDYDQYVFSPVTFSVTGTGGSQVAYFYWVDGLGTGATTHLYFCEQFPVPMPVNTLGQIVSFTPQFSLGQL